MRVLLVDIDSKIPNLALMKISAAYKKDGHKVGFNIRDPHQVYVSCIFKKNRSQAQGLKYLYPKANFTFGGSGCNYYNKLPDKVELIKPDYDLYPSDYSQGYTTRGCTKHCPWCIVQEKEGKFKRHQHISYFHDFRFKEVMLMDNNILADKKWFFSNTDFILEHNLRIREHGMDIKLVDAEIAGRLKELKHPQIPFKFAFDKVSDKKAVIKGLDILKEAKINIRRDVMFYVLVGYGTTHEEDLYRCNLLKKLGTSAFVMKYKSDRYLNLLARWANRKAIFHSCEFEEFSKL